MGDLFIEVDKNNKPIGVRPKGDFYNGKHIHRSSHLLLFNSGSLLLLQKRSQNQKWYPNLYTYSVSGTVEDETYEQCIEHEMKEEIGINIKYKRLFIYKFFNEIDKSFHAVFIAKSDFPLRLDKNEIQSIKWISLEDLKKDILKNPEKYTPPFLEGIKIFLKKNRDSFKKL